jgi:hypothetical protein
MVSQITRDCVSLCSPAMLNWQAIVFISALTLEFTVYNFSDWNLLGGQVVSIIFIFAWSGSVMGLYFYFLNAMGWFRVDPLEEEVGLDISRHKGAAYDIKEANIEDVKQLNDARANLAEGSMRGTKYVVEENKMPDDTKKDVDEPEMEA